MFAHEEGALLMERAEGTNSLVDMVRSGRDDEASRLICRDRGPAACTETNAWRALRFRILFRLRDGSGSWSPLRRGMAEFSTACAAMARELLASEREVVVLHGDIHHGNILDFGPRGWLAIDPKGLIGERGFDYANLFCNPEAEIAIAPGRLARQVDVVAEAAGLERRRLLKWIMAYAGLSAAWFLGDGEWEPAKTPLAVAELAAAELARTAS